MKPITTKYECNNCETEYATDAEAENCCKHTSEKYECAECDETYYDSDEAEECCGDKLCVCGHELLASHDNEEQMCEAWISNIVGDCPCERFEAEG